MYISGYKRTLALVFGLGVSQTLGQEGLTQSSGLSPPSPKSWARFLKPYLLYHTYISCISEPQGLETFFGAVLHRFLVVLREWYECAAVSVTCAR